MNQLETNTQNKCAVTRQKRLDDDVRTKQRHMMVALLERLIPDYRHVFAVLQLGMQLRRAPVAVGQAPRRQPSQRR